MFVRTLLSTNDNNFHGRPKSAVGPYYNKLTVANPNGPPAHNYGRYYKTVKGSKKNHLSYNPYANLFDYDS